MKRISSGIFISPGHKVTWSSNTKYLTCECKNFALSSKCDASVKVKELLESEGKQVKLKRRSLPLFIKEIDVFTERLNNILKGNE